MSNAPSPLGNERTIRLPDDTRSELRNGVTSTLGRLGAPFQFAGFWSAVVLPLTYLPILTGGFTAGERSTFAVLLALHALALVAGHGYRGD